MTLDEIKTAIEQGKRVFWTNDNYEVIKDKLGQYLIYCHLNEYCIGLTWQDKKTMNGQEEEFYIAKQTMTEKEAYSLGYFHGRALGHHGDLEIDSFSDLEKHNFKQGYDRGVADYCLLDEAKQ